MDFWNKARSLADEAAKRSQDLSFGTSSFSDIVAETTKRSKEIVFEASKRADQIRIEALKRADQFKQLAQGIRPQNPMKLVPLKRRSWRGRVLEVLIIVRNSDVFVIQQLDLFCSPLLRVSFFSSGVSYFTIEEDGEKDVSQTNLLARRDGWSGRHAGRWVKPPRRPMPGVDRRSRTSSPLDPGPP
ncbi:hypothetical protein K1719_017441 [Acacia pycnantha]|nr:hypothetical protein K1719_017441 [Acacia pycnantha]